MRRAAATAAITGVFAVSSFAAAGPVVDAATRAEALQSEGKTVEALAALEEAIDELWNAAPLAFRTVELVDVATDGERVVRSDAIFEPDETMSVYAEPVGYGFGSPGAEDAVGFTVGITIENATGQVLIEAPEAISIEAARDENDRGFGMTLSMPVPFIRPGDYTATFSVADQNSAKTAMFEMPFTVVLPGGAEAAREEAPQ